MKPRICLFSPSGEMEWYDDCEISTSLLPDLSFTGKNVNTEKREKVVTSLAYKIVSDPDTEAEKLRRACEAFAANRSGFRLIPPEAAIA